MKPFWKSKTFWGAVVAAVPGIGPVAAPIVAAVIPAVNTVDVPIELQAIVAAIGAILAIYGRWKVSGEITFKNVAH